MPDLLLRAGILYLPVLAVGLGWAWRRPSPRLAGGALLATLWSIPVLLALNALAPAAGWWRFGADAGVVLGVPVDVLLGWSLVWGALPLLLAPAGSLALILLAALWLDLLLMPRLEPVVVLGPHWLRGEVVLLAAGLAPAQLLGRWTHRRTRLAGRVALQVIGFAGLVGLVMPAAVLAHTGGSWLRLPARALDWHGLPLQALGIVAALGFAAVREFARRGGGTPVPFDPPVRLVTTGPYAYVANPMQLSGALVLFILAALLESLVLAGSAAMVVAYSAGLAAWDERRDLESRFGGDWRAYRSAVRSWLPRLRPAAVGPPARLYIDTDCLLCSDVARWLGARRPAGLRVLPARLHPNHLERMTYHGPRGGVPETGVAAMAAALQHLHMGWALVGWLMTLPGSGALLQLLVDASGAGPRPADQALRSGPASRPS